MYGKDIALLVMMLGVLATAAWAIYIGAETAKRQRRLRAQAELHGRLLDKFNSAHEVAEFLQTPGGTQFVNSFTAEREAPANGILRSAHRGIILLIVGVGFLGLIRAYGWEDNPLLVIGVVLVCLGLGFLASALISHRLAKALGVTNGHSQQ